MFDGPITVSADRRRLAWEIDPFSYPNCGLCLSPEHVFDTWCPGG